jgi:hypothetical protein
MSNTQISKTTTLFAEIEEQQASIIAGGCGKSDESGQSGQSGQFSAPFFGGISTTNVPTFSINNDFCNSFVISSDIGCK